MSNMVKQIAMLKQVRICELKKSFRGAIDFLKSFIFLIFIEKMGFKGIFHF